MINNYRIQHVVGLELGDTTDIAERLLQRTSWLDKD
jgi:hypothetical protein